MPSTTPTSGEPEVPPDIPPEYVDAYLAGFRRAYDGELTQVAAEPVDEDPRAGRRRTGARGSQGCRRARPAGEA